jgi:acyl-CoA thioester hydrolase
MPSDRFSYFLRVRYGECDAQKVVFNARYSEYVDLATAEFFRAFGYGAELVSGELDYQLVKQTIEWHAAARFDQVLELSVATKHIGNTSFTLATDFRIAGAEPLISTAETVYVLVNTHTLKKTSVPEGMRLRLTRGAPGIAVDHAAYVK